VARGFLRENNSEVLKLTTPCTPIGLQNRDRILFFRSHTHKAVACVDTTWEQYRDQCG